MPSLCVHLDDIARMRESDRSQIPDPVQAAVIAELAGADSVSCHLHPDRIHIQERDVRLIKQIVKGRMNLVITPAAELLQLAVDVLPQMVTLIGDSANESGLDVVASEREIASFSDTLHRNNISTCLLIDPDPKQARAAKRVGVLQVEIHSGYYADSLGEKQAEEYYRLANAIIASNKLGLHVSAGQGLDYSNIGLIARMEHLEEVVIGHSIASRAMMVGMDTAVRDMISLLG